jgi:UDP-2-acetamido-2,6-beta-L-arabino-hexul-4-ose reductase
VHLRKFERFVVLSGHAVVSLRRLFTGAVVRFHVSGDRPVAVDVPTLWAHKLTVSGDGAVTAFFWSDEPYAAEDPDTYPVAVEGKGATP